MDTFINYGYLDSPKEPYDFGFPRLTVKSEGKKVYTPKFAIKKETSELIIQFGHFTGGGIYRISTILEEKEVGLMLYGGGSPNSTIPEDEMIKLRSYLRKWQDRIRTKLLIKEN